MATARERAVASALAGSPRREHGNSERVALRFDARRTRPSAKPRGRFYAVCPASAIARVPMPEAECPMPGAARYAQCPMPICRSGSGRSCCSRRRSLCSRRRRHCRRRSAGSGGRRGRRDGAAHRNGGEERRSSSSSSRPALRCRLPGSSAVQDARAPGVRAAAACVAARTRASTSARAVRAGARLTICPSPGEALAVPSM